ncbi:MAG: head-tail connector protein [Ignavibacteria bacterium]|nr:head-tail connector protein [Ignavibacteria bacterium]
MQISHRALTSGLATITLEKLKEHLRITHDQQDDYITALGKAAENLITDLTDIQLRYSELEIYFNELLIDIPIQPIKTPITNELEYWDEDDYTAFDSDDYDFIMTKNNLRIYIAVDQFDITDLPVKYKYHIKLNAGFENGITDGRIELAVFMLVALWYNNNVPINQARYYKIPYSLQSIIWNLKGIIFHEAS